MPEVVEARHAGKIISRVEDKGLRVFASSTCCFNQLEAESFFEGYLPVGIMDSLISELCSGRSLGLVVEGENAIDVLLELAGDIQTPCRGSLRKRFGSTAVHVSPSLGRAVREAYIVTYDRHEIVLPHEMNLTEQ